MDIARLGVALDPQPFVRGEKEVNAALDRMKNKAAQSGAAMENSSRKNQRSFNAMAEAARTAASGIRSAFDGMSNAVGIFSPKLGFALQALRGFAAFTGQTIQSVRSLATGTQAAGGGMRGFAAALGTVAAVGATVIGVMTGLLAVILPLVAAFKAVSFAFSLFSDGLKEASTFESIKIRFAGVLGSMEAAEVRMKQLAKLAADTPFELEGIANASLTLENLTAGAFSSIEALTKVGDAAAKSGQDIATTAEQIGRIFAGLKQGVGFDDPLRTLTARGVFSADTYQRIMAMNQAGAEFGDMWKVIVAQLDRAGGSMKNLSVSFEGRVSTMNDAWTEFKRTLGEAILPAATDVVKGLTDGIAQLTEYAKSIQPQIQAMADNAVAFIRVLGEEGGLETAMQAAGDALESALNGGFDAFTAKVNEWIKSTFGVDLKAAVNDLANADIWAILANDIFPKLGKALFTALRNAVLGAFQDIGNFITFGAAGKVGNALSTVVGADIGTAIGEISSAGGGGTPGVVSTAADAQAFMDQLPFSADGASGTFDLNTGAELLPDLNANTSAVQDLTAIIDEVRMQSSIPDWMKDSGPSNSLFPPELADTSAGSKLQDMMNRELGEMQAGRAADKASMTFLKPTPAEDFVMPSKGKKKGRGGKSEAEKMQDEADKITKSLRTPAEEMQDTIKNLEKLRDAGKISAETFERGVAKAKEDYEGAIDSMTKKAKKAADEQQSALQQLMTQWGDLAKQMDQANVAIAQSVSGNITNAITGMIDGTMSASEAFSKMAASIVSDILKIITQMMVQYAIQSALGMVTGGFGGAAAAAVAHDGGIAGFPTDSRTVNPNVFRGAQKYHSGGTVGLAPGEVPIIAEKGEVITTEDQEKMKARLRGEKAESKQQVQMTNINVVDARMIDEHINKNPDAMLNVISRNKTRVKQILSIQ